MNHRLAPRPHFGPQVRTRGRNAPMLSPGEGEERPRQQQNQERPQPDCREDDRHDEDHGYQHDQDDSFGDARLPTVVLGLEFGPHHNCPLLDQDPCARGQHRADMKSVGALAALSGRTEELGRERQEHDARDPYEHPDNQETVVAHDVLEHLVLTPPDGPDDSEAEAEG